MADDTKAESSGISAAKNVWATSIIASLIASAVFLIFFQPILTAASRITTSILGSVASGALDSIFQQAAIGYLQPIIFNIQMIFIVVLFNISLIPVIAVIAKKQSDEAASKSGEAKEESRICKFCRRTAFVTPVVAGLIAIYLLSSSYICIQAESSFSSYMAASAPHITDQEEEVIRAQWALMDSRSDYTAIMDDLESRAQLGEWILPPRLI